MTLRSKSWVTDFLIDLVIKHKSGELHCLVTALIDEGKLGNALKKKENVMLIWLSIDLFCYDSLS